MITIKDYIKQRSERKAIKKIRKNVAYAENRYQVKEYDGELYLTFDGCLVCPCNMLKQEPVEAIRAIRELYVKRNSL